MSGTKPNQLLQLLCVCDSSARHTLCDAAAGGTHSYPCVLYYRTNTIGWDRHMGYVKSHSCSIAHLHWQSWRDYSPRVVTALPSSAQSKNAWSYTSNPYAWSSRTYAPVRYSRFRHVTFDLIVVAAARVGEVRCIIVENWAHLLAGNPERNRSFDKPKRRWWDSINI